MKWYAVQDSDWDWDSADGEAILVLADSPENAVKRAYEKTDGFSGCDAAHMKVAEISLVGFMGGDRVGGTYRNPIPWEWDEFYPNFQPEFA